MYLNGHHVADHDTTLVEGPIPADSEILAIQLHYGINTIALFALHTLNRTVQFKRQFDFPGNTPHGQIADCHQAISPVLDPRAPEVNLRIILGIEELGTTKVVIP